MFHFDRLLFQDIEIYLIIYSNESFLCRLLFNHEEEQESRFNCRGASQLDIYVWNLPLSSMALLCFDCLPLLEHTKNNNGKKQFSNPIYHVQINTSTATSGVVSMPRLADKRSEFVADVQVHIQFFSSFLSLIEECDTKDEFLFHSFPSAASCTQQYEFPVRSHLIMSTLNKKWNVCRNKSFVKFLLPDKFFPLSVSLVKDF